MHKTERRRPGRPKRGISTNQRDHIVAVATLRFAQRGYKQTSVRSIAADAGVDPALVRYYFGSKGELFAATAKLHTSPGTVVKAAARTGDVSRLPHRILALAIRTWERPQAAEHFAQLISTNGAFAGYIDAEVVGGIAAALPGSRRRERASAAVQVLAGLIFTRYVLAVPSIAKTPASEAYSRTLPLLQAALSGAGSGG